MFGGDVRCSKHIWISVGLLMLSPCGGLKGKKLKNKQDKPILKMGTKVLEHGVGPVMKLLEDLSSFSGSFSKRPG